MLLLRQSAADAASAIWQSARLNATVRYAEVCIFSSPIVTPMKVALNARSYLVVIQRNVAKSNKGKDNKSYLTACVTAPLYANLAV